MTFEKHDIEIEASFKALYDTAVDLWWDIDTAVKGAKEDGHMVRAAGLVGARA